MNTDITKHLIISGRVQGVGFRYFTKKSAESLGVSGWVKNLRSGDVEAVLQGSSESVDEMMNRLEAGPTTARVDEIKELEDEPTAQNRVNGFNVKR